MSFHLDMQVLTKGPSVDLGPDRQPRFLRGFTFVELGAGNFHILRNLPPQIPLRFEIPLIFGDPSQKSKNYGAPPENER